MSDLRFFTYAETEILFHQYEIPLPKAKIVQTPHEACKVFQLINSPVAVKVVSKAESHKSDKGLVYLNVNNTEDVLRTVEKLITKSKRFSIEGILVQAMAPEGIEVITGLVNDPTFGMMLVYGAGGVLVELLDTITLRLTPIQFDEARWLIKQHPTYPLLEGFRGKPPVNYNALANLLVKLSVLGHENSAMIESLDINPVIVSQEGVHLVDIRIKKKGSDHE